MCGIAGIIYKNSRNVKEEELSKMVHSLKHRGPDENGIFNFENIGFAHTRLSIIDLKTGKQPMSSLSKNTVITFNGEIYNYLELKKEFKTKKLKSSSDTEILLELYEKYGISFINKLNGMFSFALYDLKNKKFFFVRDRVGIKPFFYFNDDEKFIFASEIKGILAILNQKPSINIKALGEYFKFGYIPAPDTVFSSIKKLMPAHYIEMKDGIIKKVKYWNKDSNNIKNTNFLQLMEDSVRLRMISDVPVGGFLSGGIDSSAIVTMMSKFTNKLETFSIGFSNKNYDETKYSSIIVKRLNCKHREFTVHEKGLDMVDHLINFIDEPMSDPSIIPTYHVCKLASKTVKVVLSGDGADELFGGYERYKFSVIAKFLRKYSMKTITPKTLYLINKFLKPFNGKFYVNRLEKFLKFTFGNEDPYLGSIQYFSEEELRKNSRFPIYKSNIYENLDIKNIEEYMEAVLDGDFNYYLNNDILVKLDRMSMSLSLEARVPFLDHRIVEFASNISANKKFGYFNLKKYLKKEFENLLPREILYRRKMGFTLPLKEWFAEKHHQFIKDELLNSPYISNYFNKTYIENLLIDHRLGRKNNSYKLYNLFVFNRWCMKKLF